MVSDLPGYGTIWYDPKSITNILSLKCVNEKYHVTFNSKHSGSFIVTKPNGTVFKFKESNGGLYFLDTNKSETVLVNTVADNKVNFTNKDYLKAVSARELQTKIITLAPSNLFALLPPRISYPAAQSPEPSSLQQNTSLVLMWDHSKARW